jgi:hypothetical protein
MGLVLVAAAVAVLAAVSGCGGGSDSTSVTKASYVKKVNAICKDEEEKRFGELMARGQKIEEEAKGKEISTKVKEEALLSLIPSYEKMVDHLRALDAPAGDEEKVEAVYDAMDEAAENMRENPGTALVSEAAFAKASKLSKAYGLSCEF